MSKRVRLCHVALTVFTVALAHIVTRNEDAGWEDHQPYIVNHYEHQKKFLDTY